MDHLLQRKKICGSKGTGEENKYEKMPGMWKRVVRCDKILRKLSSKTERMEIL